MLRLARRERPKCRTRLVALTGLLLLVGAAISCHSADARPIWQRIVPSMGVFESDGERYVAWQFAGVTPTMEVLDTLTGQRRQVAGCGLADVDEWSYTRGSPASHGLFLVYCNEPDELLNAATGAVQALPGGSSVASRAVVGARYVEGEASPSHCRQDAGEKREHDPCIALYEIDTGAVSYRPQSRPGDLDRSGAPLVCPALRKKVIEEPKEVMNNPTVFSGYEGDLFGEAGQSLRISRCHGRPIVVGDRHRGEPHFDLDTRGGLVSWDSGHNVLECAYEGCSSALVRHGSVSAYSRAARRRWTVAAPERPVYGEQQSFVGTFGYSSHTRTMLFWIAPRTLGSDPAGDHVEQSTVYAAKI
jgi:hypothetical protein